MAFSLTGCVSGMVQDAIDAADERVRLKWAEEWRPALEGELLESLAESQGFVLDRMLVELEGQEEQIEARLAAVNVRIEDFDEDQDGLVTDAEALTMVNELRQATDEHGNPLGWYEILMAVILGYGGTTAGKEWVKSKMTSGTGDGSVPV
jgi:hypothetical protein